MLAILCEGESMKFLRKAKDGGPKSTVTGYWLAEIKSLFSIVLLKFEDGSRDEYHSHAFNSVNWILKGRVTEQVISPTMETKHLSASARPVLTPRERTHRVVSEGTTWVLSFRGPWAKTWQEYNPRTWKWTTLGHGRVEQ